MGLTVMKFSFAYFIAVILGLASRSGQPCQRDALMSKVMRSCLPALLGLMLWFTAAVPAQAQAYNVCPDLDNLPSGGVVWLDLSTNRCFNPEPPISSDVITVEYNSIAQTYRVAYFSAVPPNGQSFGTVVFAGIPLTEGFFSSSVSCPSGCSLSGTYGGSPISATVSGTSVKPSGPTDTTPPTIQSINRLTPSTEFTTATTLTWRVTFSEDVQNVDVGDFGLRDVPTGVVTGGLNLSLTPIDARAYNLTAQFTRNSSALDGYVEVGNRGGGIEDLAGNTLANTINSQPYRYDTTPVSYTHLTLPTTPYV